MRSIRLLLITLLASFILSATLDAAERPPNLIIILTDDQGYSDVGFNGCKDIPTPNIDRIAAGGARCTNGYVTYAVCGPSRAGLITGRYQDRFGACRNPTIDPTVPNNGVPVEEKNIAELLAPVGYKSMAVGKWHLGTFPNLRPLERGFDEFFGFLSGGHDYLPKNLTLEDLSEVRRQWDWYRTKLLRNEERVEIEDYLTDELSAAGVDFIERHHEEPFFLYMAYNAPHTPMQATKKYLARFSHIENKRRRTYAAMISAVDDGVGRLLDKVAEHQLEENTIIVFLSDNGGATNNSANNRPLRGHKGDPFEGGVRVPFAIRWTGTIPAGIDYEMPVSSLDIAATIVAHSGASVAADKQLDGVDLVPFLARERSGSPHPVLFWRWFDHQNFAVRLGDEKLILMGSEKHREKYGEKLLFDLGSDLRERTNLFGSRTESLKQLTTQLAHWSEQLIDPLAPGLGTWKSDNADRKQAKR